MGRSGPVTKDATTVALGLAQIRVGASAANIGNIAPALSSTNSIGAMASTKFTSTVDTWKLESGFPLIEDATIPIREKAMMEVSFKEVTPMNLAFARGIDATSGYTLAHSGEIKLGNAVAPVSLRMEASYVYPDGVNEMMIIFPKAQVTQGIELDLKAEDSVAVPITFESKNASSDSSSGHAVWDNMPLGRIYFRVKV
jgi:hypothetical protein